jgi:hypothetical protein
MVAFETYSKLRIIEEYAFAGSWFLKSFTIPASVETFCSYCFDARSIETLTIEFGSRLRQIDQSIFFGCKTLRSLRIPASIRFLPQDETLFEVITFESMPGKSFSNPIVQMSGDVPLDDFRERYDQFLIDLANYMRISPRQNEECLLAHRGPMNA